MWIGYFRQNQPAHPQPACVLCSHGGGKQDQLLLMINNQVTIPGDRDGGGQTEERPQHRPGLQAVPQQQRPGRPHGGGLVQPGEPVQRSYI